MKAISTAKALLGLEGVEKGECVILLHGLARSSVSFTIMELRLKWDGYSVVNVNYASKAGSIEELALSAISSGLKAADGKRVHFVTHSLGGILVRHYLKNHKVENLGHVVMLGPPNKGSSVVDDWNNFPGFELVNGVAGRQLSTDEDSLPNRLGPVNFPLGIIAGSNNINPIFGQSFDGPNDGKVSVESTLVEGMSDHIVLHVTHTFMMNDDAVYKQVLSFLQNKAFDPALLNVPSKD